jgi:hypothetical protein
MTRLETASLRLRLHLPVDFESRVATLCLPEPMGGIQWWMTRIKFFFA